MWTFYYQLHSLMFFTKKFILTCRFCVFNNKLAGLHFHVEYEVTSPTVNCSYNSWFFNEITECRCYCYAAIRPFFLVCRVAALLKKSQMVQLHKMNWKEQPQVCTQVHKLIDPLVYWFHFQSVYSLFKILNWISRNWISNNSLESKSPFW